MRSFKDFVGWFVDFCESKPTHTAMSLHAPLSEETLNELRRERRRRGISSVIVSLMVISLTAVLLGLYLLPAIERNSPVIVAYQAPMPDTTEPSPKKFNRTVSRKPSAPSMSMSRVLAANTAAPVTVPVPEVVVEIESTDFGSSVDFGLGWDGSSSGSGGAGSHFGSTGSIPGALAGHLYDFKQNASGKKVAYDLTNRAEFVDRVVRTQRSRFSEPSLARYFRAPNQLNLTHLAVPFSDAASGPETFGAKDSIQPSGWLAVYHGRIAAPVSGRFRFVGVGDDYLTVFVNRRLALVGCWPDIQSSVQGRWTGTEAGAAVESPLGGVPLVFGDWVDLKAGEVVDVSIGIGERPGGKVGFVLQVEQDGVTYQRDAKGRKVLPLFTTAAFSVEQRERVTREFGDYRFDWDQVPVFGVK